jgi:acetyl esterase/lipase
VTKDWADLTMGNGIGDAIADHGNAAVSWQSRSLEWLLRALVKGRLGPGIDFIALRRRLEHVDRLLFGMPRNARCTPLEASGVQSEWIEVPQTRPERVLLYFHGGGFAVRSPNLYRRFVARISRRLRTRALLVDYRLAPEHPFPAGVDDCLTPIWRL